MNRDGDSPITHPDDGQPVLRTTGRRGSALTATPVRRTGGHRRTATSAARTAAPGGASSTRTSRSGSDLVTRDGDAPITFEQLYERFERTRATLETRGPGPIPRTVADEFVEASVVYVDALHLLIGTYVAKQRLLAPLGHSAHDR
jgi:hypothetical protein